MSRKREKPSHFSRHGPFPSFKRRRPLPSSAAAAAYGETPASNPTPPPDVVVTGLPHNCSVLDLKSRFEIYGPISRIRIDRDEVGYIRFRSADSAVAAIAASGEPSLGITIESQRVQVSWTLQVSGSHWGVGVGMNQDSSSKSSPSSRLLKAEVPLSKHGRGNKLASTIVNPRTRTSGFSDVPFRGREIIAYDDDIL